MADAKQQGYLSRIKKWARILVLIMTIAMMIFVVWRGIEKALQSKTSVELAGWILASIILATLIGLFSYALAKWDHFSERLENQFKIYPTFRRWVIFPGVLTSVFLGFWQLKLWDAEITLKIIVALYFALVLPAALISLIRDDRAREKSNLGSKISRELFVQNPQATVAYAFTIIEDRLKEKVGSETNAYGDALINEAFAGEKSKLVLVLAGKDYTSHLRNLLSGSYGLLRNPRHHGLVEDNEHVASGIFAVADLLSHFIEASERRSK